MHLRHPAVERVTAIGRRTLGISHTKLKEVLHPNFGDCSALAESLSHQDAAIFCLGAYTGAVSETELRTITVDYTIEFARVLHNSSPNAGFAFLSGQGADPTGKSRIAFARYKGEAENAILAAGFHAVYIFRPAYIYPVKPRKEPNLGYRLLRDLSRTSDAVSQPGDPGRRFGTSDGRRRRARNKGAPRIGVREQRYPGHGRLASAPHGVIIRGDSYPAGQSKNRMLSYGRRSRCARRLLIADTTSPDVEMLVRHRGPARAAVSNLNLSCPSSSHPVRGQFGRASET